MPPTKQAPRQSAPQPRPEPKPRGVTVTAAPASTDYLGTVELTVSGLDPAKRYDVLISDPDGHLDRVRSIEPTPEGTYPYTVVVDLRGTFTVEVFPAAESVASTTFRGA